MAKKKRLGRDDLKCNKPKKDRSTDHKRVVLACDGGKKKLVRYGKKGYSDYTKHKDKERRDNFHARHKCDQKKNKLTPGYWACKDLW